MYNHITLFRRCVASTAIALIGALAAMGAQPRQTADIPAEILAVKQRTPLPDWREHGAAVMNVLYFNGVISTVAATHVALAYRWLHKEGVDWG